MDRVAETLGLDPVPLRDRERAAPRRHHRHRAASGPRRQRAGGAARGGAALAVPRQARGQWRGTGRGHRRCRCSSTAPGFTGGGEVKLASQAALELTATGARILVASTEIGQGTRTMHAQIVADALGVPYDRVEVVHAVDTAAGARQRADGGVAHLHGRRPAARALRAPDEARRLGGLDPAPVPAAPRRLHDHASATRSRPGIAWDDDALPRRRLRRFGWACNVVELEVDPVTCEVTPRAPHRGGARSARPSTRSWPRARSRAAPSRGWAGR